MKTIIAGSRNCTKYKTIEIAIELCPFVVTSVVSGKAKGGDRVGERYAIANNLPLYKFPADWKQYGKSAGYIRNTEMAENAEALIALWDGFSNGTRNMIEIARRKKFPILVYNYVNQTISIHTKKGWVFLNKPISTILDNPLIESLIDLTY